VTGSVSAFSVARQASRASSILFILSIPVNSMSKVPTKILISAGGVAFRKRGKQTEVALISVGDDARWQLPKGVVDSGESTEAAALREVREEAGINTRVIERIDKVECWYFWNEEGQRVRYHKFVYFYLLGYKSGDVIDHDHEVNEARWVEINEALQLMAFDSERKIVEKAKALIG
jgi:8-oxo-dGTP diphosphatase